MDAQIDNFANTRQDIISSIGLPAAMQLFEKALFSATIGSNDFINNYLTPVVSTAEQKLVSPEMFVANVISRLRSQLTVKSFSFFTILYTKTILVPLFLKLNLLCTVYCRDFTTWVLGKLLWQMWDLLDVYHIREIQILLQVTAV